MSSNKEAGSIDLLIGSMLDSVKARFYLFSSGSSLVWAEFKVAASHAGLLIGLIIISAGLLLVAWIMLLIVGALFLHGVGFGAVQAVLLMLLLHMVLLMAVILLIRHTVTSITFTRTRDALKRMATESESAEISVSAQHSDT